MARQQQQRRAVAILAAALALVAVVLAPTPAGAALTVTQSSDWGKYISDMQATQVGAAPLVNSLTTVLTAHDFSTPLQGIKASNSYTGSNARFRRVVKDLLAGKPVKVVAIGGVATNGSDASDPGRNDYFTRYVAFLARAFPSASIKPVRASAGLAPSAIVAGCLDRYLDSDADLVLLEMTANDGATMDSSIVNAYQPRAYEILVRKVMRSKKAPALILTQVRVGALTAWLGLGLLRCFS